MALNVLLLDAHPDAGDPNAGDPADPRLITHLLDHYQAALARHPTPPEIAITRVNIRDLAFDPHLRRGYRGNQPWEPDLERAAQAIADCDHLVVGFPLWWGAEPAGLKGFLDRVIQPGFGFRYHREDLWWDRLLAGRSADLIVTMDTPPWYLRLVYGDPVMRRWRTQILGFCGFHPIRQFRFGPTRRGAAKRQIAHWEAQLTEAAASVAGLRRHSKIRPTWSEAGFETAFRDRQS